MKSLNLKKNRKGMTLVEVVTAMSVFSVASLMIVMTLCAAAKSIGDNYKRSDDVNHEGIYAETFDVNKSMTSGNTKVERNNIANNGTNQVKITTDFGGTDLFSVDNVYAYKSKLPGKSYNVTYQMQFFQKKSNFSDCVDPSANKYYVIIYNDSDSEINNWTIKIPDTNSMFDSDNKSYSGNTVECGIVPGSGGSAGLGIQFNDPNECFQVVNESGDVQFTLTQADLANFAETTTAADGSTQNTGMIYVHYLKGNFINQDTFNKSIIDSEYDKNKDESSSSKS